MRRRPPLPLRAALAFALGGCATHDVGTPPKAPLPTAVERAEAPSPPRVEYAAETRSPWPSALDARTREREMTAACGEPDGALARVAADLAAERAHGESVDADRVGALLRMRGEPHVRPRVVTVTSHGPSDDKRVRGELATSKRPTTRCGIAFGPATGGDETMIALVVDALADLDPFPTRGRTGQWLTFSAVLNVPARDAKLVVLGSRGLPRTIPTSLDARGRAVGRFALDRPGAFTVQLLADVGEGPRPLLEARVFADVAPAADDGSLPAPGEEAAVAGDDASTLAGMTATLRREEALPSLRRDERLDAVARAHVEAMKAAHSVAHDLGDGNLTLRFETAGLAAKNIGENVARARSIGLAHRTLHASPSHRMNLLRADYTHAGFAAVRDGEDVYVCEVFASGLR